jgi:hypothetical protein
VIGLVRFAGLIGGRLALVPVLLVSLSGLAAVRFFGPRINAGMLAEVRAAGGEEVKNLKRSIAVFALCAGCAVGDPGGGSMLLPGSDAATGVRGPGAVPLDDGGAPLVDVAPGADVVPLADLAAPADSSPLPGDLASPADALPFPLCGSAAADVPLRLCPGGGVGSRRRAGLICVACSGVPAARMPCLAPVPAGAGGLGSCKAEPYVVCSPCSECPAGGAVCQ